ncbi:MAG: hypothetical protein ACOZAJ_02005 [Patescibacteria group bacterium]
MRGSNSLFHLRGQGSIPPAIYSAINNQHIRGSSGSINKSYLKIKRKNGTDYRGTHLKN